MQPLTQGEGLHVYFKLQVFFYTLTKALGQKFDIFSSPLPIFIMSRNHCCPSNRVPASAMRIVFTCDYITHAYFWVAYHIPQFISYLSKSCLPLVSYAHYLLKRLLAILNYSSSLSSANFLCHKHIPHKQVSDNNPSHASSCGLCAHPGTVFVKILEQMSRVTL